MTVQVTIIGLGQIGASLGMALEAHKSKLLRVGNDLDPGIARAAQKQGAVDRVEINLHNSVSNADLVILAVPMDQLRPVVQTIAPDLRLGCVVMDTAPVKRATLDWIKTVLPEQRHYVGLAPVVNPAYLQEKEHGLPGARADLFKGGQIGIVAGDDADPAALKMAADLVALLGAKPIFSEALELDGLMAAVHVLPQLMALALLQATVEQPGWREARRLAGLPYADVVWAAQRSSSAAALQAQASLNRENTLRVVDDTLAALQTIRKALAADDPAALLEMTGRLLQAQEAWQRGKRSAEWEQTGAPPAEMPNAGAVFGRLLGINTRKPRKP